MVADDRFDRGKELGGGHQTDRHAGAAEDRLDDLAVAEVGDDHAVLDRVAPDDPAGRHFRLKTGSFVEDSWCTSFRVGTPRS